MLKEKYKNDRIVNQTLKSLGPMDDVIESWTMVSAVESNPTTWPQSVAEKVLVSMTSVGEETSMKLR